LRQKEAIGHGSWLEWLDINLPDIPHPRVAPLDGFVILRPRMGHAEKERNAIRILRGAPFALDADGPGFHIGILQ